MASDAKVKKKKEGGGLREREGGGSVLIGSWLLVRKKELLCWASRIQDKRVSQSGIRPRLPTSTHASFDLDHICTVHRLLVSRILLAAPGRAGADSILLRRH
ncbi:hypothetical protein D4764_22G0007280 [Takifugu flavidus]|uniref:Uncharacterized protein n=1 Tax=Takifugu flavidus TaxID=433684 RepID=A0A5C6NEU9_9TELE|nr:hypothetical protein D4764_22G0007280 [Takifugu flavidus]